MTIRAALELDSQNTLTDLLSMHIGGQQTNCVTFQANVAMSSIRMMWSDADVMMVTGPSDHSSAVCLRCISKASADKLRNPSNHPHHIWPLDVIQTPRIRLTHYPMTGLSARRVQRTKSSRFEGPVRSQDPRLLNKIFCHFSNMTNLPLKINVTISDMTLAEN